MKRILFSVAVLFWLSGVVHGDLAGRINAILSQPEQKKMVFSIHVVRADSGKEIYTYNGDQTLIPASNMKLIVSAAAFKYLGKDFEYVTQIGLCGNTLVVIGSGDPLLGDMKTDEKYGRKAGWIFDDIIQKLQQENIKDINNIVIDTSVFDDQRVHPNWPANDLNQWYAAEVCGLNYNNNCIDMTVQNVQGKAVISIEPQTTFLKIDNQVNIISQGKEAVGAYRKAGQINKIKVAGNCRDKEGPFPVAIERPAAFFGFILAERLAAGGIRINGQLSEQTISKDCNFKKIAEYKTSFTDCLARCNKNSLQLSAEAMFKSVGKKVFNNGSWEGGRKAIEQYLISLNISRDEFNIDDGCGLSKQNKLSACSITTVLKDMHDNSDWEIYKKSLAIGGIDGTIAKHFEDEKYKGRIIGKTGYMIGIISFSGVCSSKTGDYIFSILTIKNSRGRKPLNDIAQAIIDEFDS